MGKCDGGVVKVGVFDSVVIARVSLTVDEIVGFGSEVLSEETHDLVQFKIRDSLAEFHVHYFELTPRLG